MTCKQAIARFFIVNAGSYIILKCHNYLLLYSYLIGVLRVCVLTFQIIQQMIKPYLEFIPKLSFTFKTKLAIIGNKLFKSCIPQSSQVGKFNGVKYSFFFS